jgi:DnaJ-class molecular chaperone
MTGDRNDHYTVLGVDSTASPEEITHAFHRLVRRYHPDARVDQGGVEDLSEVIAAYQVLRDPTRRADYDRQHQRPPQTSAPSRPIPDAFGTAELPLHVGPVRYHGPTLPTDHVVCLIRAMLTDDWW